MTSRKIEDLDPELGNLTIQLIHTCKLLQIDLLVTCTYRSRADQDALFAQGRTNVGLIVTHARGGESLHNVTVNSKPASRAVDVVPLIGGKPFWQTEGRGAAIWQTVGNAGMRLGLEWGGNWPAAKRDYAHFQLTKKGENHVENNPGSTERT